MITFALKLLHLAVVVAKNPLVPLPADELTKMTIKVLKRDSKFRHSFHFSNEQFIQEDSSLVLSFFFHKICTKNVFHGGGL